MAPYPNILSQSSVRQFRLDPFFHSTQQVAISHAKESKSQLRQRKRRHDILPRLLSKSKSFGALLDGLEKVCAQFVVRLVGGQVELVEAGVRRRQPVGGTVVSVDLEFLRPVHPLQRREALQRHFRRPRHELHEFGLVGLVKGAQSAPEPDDLQRVGLVFVVLCVGFEVVYVDVGQSG